MKALLLRVPFSPWGRQEVVQTLFPDRKATFRPRGALGAGASSMRALMGREPASWAQVLGPYTPLALVLPASHAPVRDDGAQRTYHGPVTGAEGGCTPSDPHHPWMVMAGYHVGCGPCFFVPL